ncbi:MAG TPA: chromate efflux transporter [Methylomirabilota bacterium]|jgi:chromate transporter|nr:chromate efflux transporter [Methylomirabilota bacterium]
MSPSSPALREVVGLFLKLGLVAFGGPAAHIAMMREEVVRRRRWLSDERFLDLLGMTNLIPGPNSTEMAIHLGYLRAGWPGLLLGGACFIVPAMLIVGALAWAYVRFGARPEITWLLYGIKPVIIAVVVQAVWGLARTAVKGAGLAAVGAAVLVLALLGVNEIALLFGGAVAGALVATGRRARALLAAPIVSLLAASGPALAQVAAGSGASLGTLFLTFLKIGAVLYGSGYVLLAFLRNDFVHRLGWLTDQQLLDAVSIGQLTPGPVFTTATFIGYLVGGFPGAGLATLAIFLPSFVFVALSHPLIPRIRSSPRTAALLDGVNVAALGLMAAVTLQLARAAIVDWLTAILAAAAAVLLIRFAVGSVWLIVAGAILGAVYRMMAG